MEQSNNRMRCSETHTILETNDEGPNFFKNVTDRRENMETENVVTALPDEACMQLSHVPIPTPQLNVG